MLFCVIAAATVVRLALGPDLVFLAAAAALAAISSLLLANWWAVRHGCELVTPEDRERRIAQEVSNRPLWHLAVLWSVLYSVMLSATPLLVNAYEHLGWRDVVLVEGPIVLAAFPLFFALGVWMAAIQRRAARTKLAESSGATAAGTPARSWRADQMKDYLFVFGAALATAGLAAIVAGWLLESRAVAAIAFFQGFLVGLLLALLRKYGWHAHLDVRSNEITLARAFFFGLVFGAPFALVFAAVHLIAVPSAQFADLVQTFVFALSVATYMALFLWAFEQARDWTPG